MVHIKVFTTVFKRVSILPGEMCMKFIQHSPTKSAGEDASDSDSRSLDASMLWCDCFCLQRSHWKCAWVKTGKRPEFPAANSQRPKELCARDQTHSFATLQ